MHSKLFQSFTFKNGTILKNRLSLAPLTNQQSNEDGTLSDEEFHWLTMRAKGGFGMVVTCASHVQSIGKGFPGQLGIFSDFHLEGHKRLAKEIKKHGALALVQLHHAGMRSPIDCIGGMQPVCPSDNEKTKARALTLDEVIQLKCDFVSAAVRAKKAGYDGVEIHAAHGYILAQFLSPKINQRNDKFGGSLENRLRLILEIIEEVSKQCGNDFLIGIRISPERFGLELEEILEVYRLLIQQDIVDFIDVSLWDYEKLPEEQLVEGKKLLDYFLEIPRNSIGLTVAGKIYGTNDVHSLLEKNIDFLSLGKAAILHHDFPLQLANNSDFHMIQTPVSESYLEKQGLSPKFIDYMRKWPDFVK